MKLIKATPGTILVKWVCDDDVEILEAAGFECNMAESGEVFETWEKRPDAKLLECVFDLAYEIGYRAAGGEFFADDSRELFANVLHWAREFENGFTPEMDENGEYLERITDFAAEKLRELK